MALSLPKSVTELLTELGLTTHEAAIYVAVLRLGEAGAAQILAEVPIHREQLYRALRQLVERGLLTQHEKRGKQHFKAIDPSVLVTRAQAQLAAAESAREYLEKVRQHQRQIIRVTEGQESLQTHLDDIEEALKNGGEYLIISGYGERFYEVASPYIKPYDRSFKARGITGRILLTESGTSYAATIIYGGKVALELLEPDDLAVITIENQRIADSYRETFEKLWNTEKNQEKKWSLIGFERIETK